MIFSVGKPLTKERKRNMKTIVTIEGDRYEVVGVKDLNAVLGFLQSLRRVDHEHCRTVGRSYSDDAYRSETAYVVREKTETSLEVVSDKCLLTRAEWATIEAAVKAQDLPTPEVSPVG